MHFAFRLFIYFSVFAALVLTLRHLTSSSKESLPYERTPHSKADRAVYNAYSTNKGSVPNMRIEKSDGHSVFDMMPMQELTTEKEVDFLIQLHPVLLFSKTFCPYSTRAKNVLNRYKSMSPRYHVIEVDLRPDAADIKAYLTKKTGRSTFPNVFIDRRSVGGGDELAAMDVEGKLERLLRQLELIQ